MIDDGPWEQDMLKKAKPRSEITAHWSTVRPWLIDIGARCMWSEKGPKDTGIANIECWMLGSTLVIFMAYKDIGWDYFIQSKTDKINECLDELKAVIEKGAL